MSRFAVTVDDDGWIVLDGRRLNQRDAADLATRLLEGVQLSLNRNQVGAKHYNDSAAILRRAQSPLGRAISAARSAL